ncbi:hypothetical protein ACFL2V_08220 [Pseudomonadota bacterium]
MAILKMMKYALINKYNAERMFWGLLLLLITLAVCPASAMAFYEGQSGDLFVDARGLVRGFISASRYPSDDALFPDRRSSGAAGVARIMVDGEMGDNWRFELNAYQSFIPNALVGSQGGASLPSSVERSALFEASFSDNDHVRLAVDRIALRWSKDNLEFTAGRQAINLATTFYFTPNDFFAPFAAQTFYRVYKPGVDAFRAEIGIGQLSQLSLISVLGYGPDTTSSTGWSRYSNSQRDSQLLRWSSAFGNAEATFLGGRVADKNIIGGALQGELFDWLGVRVEGHHADPQTVAGGDYRQLSLGVEHRWESSLDLRLELLYNGVGNDLVSSYQVVVASNDAIYLARRYSAFGGSYEVTPLLLMSAVLISNMDDHSHLISLNSVYSLSDESEAVFNVSTPLGNRPANGLLRSEFGAYPNSMNLEYRLYF